MPRHMIMSGYEEAHWVEGKTELTNDPDKVSWVKECTWLIQNNGEIMGTNSWQKFNCDERRAKLFGE